MPTPPDLAAAPEPAAAPDADFSPRTPELLYERRGAVAVLTFNRPQARNAMTWAMYEGLFEACEHVDRDERVRVFLLRGAGDRAFVAGTDIAQFRAFSTAQHALDYEANGNRILGRLEAVAKPTIAVIRGYCVGGGAAIAAVCDLRLAAPDARFGFPIARTLGNTLSAENFARLVQLIGAARTKELIFTARFIEAEEGRAIGLFNEVVAADDLERRAFALAEQVAANAPLTLRSAKLSVNRILEQARTADTRDLILLCYLSRDFREGVAAFLEKRDARWEGR
jgi:enoyl-CoA hydratase/carnithine racemase